MKLQITVLKTEVDDGAWYLLNMDADKAINLWLECTEKIDSYNAQVGKLTNKVIKDMTFKANTEVDEKTVDEITTIADIKIPIYTKVKDFGDIVIHAQRPEATPVQSQQPGCTVETSIQVQPGDWMILHPSGRFEFTTKKLIRIGGEDPVITIKVKGRMENIFAMQVLDYMAGMQAATGRTFATQVQTGSQTRNVEVEHSMTDEDEWKRKSHKQT